MHPVFYPKEGTIVKLTSCSQCGKPVDNKKTSIVGHKRICHECRKLNKEKMSSWTVDKAN